MQLKKPIGATLAALLFASRAGFNRAAEQLRLGETGGAASSAEELTRLVARLRAFVDAQDTAAPELRVAQENLTETLR